MEGTKETSNPGAADEAAGTPQRDAEATSSETLGDIEESEKVSTGAGSESSPLETSTPAPDAGGEGRADGSETGGPM